MRVAECGTKKFGVGRGTRRRAPTELNQEKRIGNWNTERGESSLLEKNRGKIDENFGHTGQPAAEGE